MSSIVGKTGNAGQSNYAASKAGVISITKSLGAEYFLTMIRPSQTEWTDEEIEDAGKTYYEIYSKSTQQLINLNVKVMVIDDSKTIRRSAETLLKKVGCEVVTAIDGFEALAKITEHKPDIIFVDIMMPRLDGYQTCALIKNNQNFKATPVIMLSSKDSIFDRARGRIVGSEKYLTKPFSREDLINAITTHVGRG